MKKVSDNEFIAKGAILRLGKQAGVKLNDLMLEEIRAVTKIFLESILKSVILYLEYDGTDKITETMVNSAFKYSLYARTFSYEACGYYLKRNLNIPSKSFTSAVNQIARYYKNDLLFSVKATRLLHWSTEKFIVGLLRDAHLIATNAKRVRVMPKDIHLARKLRVRL